VERGESAQAGAIARQALRRYPGEDSPWHWRFHLLTAEILLNQSDVEKALPLLRVNIPSGPAFAEPRARLLFDRGWAKYQQSDYRDALEILNASHALAAAANLDRLLGEIELRRGATKAHIAAEAPGAEADFRAVLRRNREPFLRASALGNVGVICMKNERYDEAIQLYGETIPLWKSLGAKTQHARELNNLASCYSFLGDPEKALGLLNDAEALAPGAGAALDRQIGLGHIGDCYAGLNRPQDARAQYERALAVARTMTTRYWVSYWLNRLAVISLQLGNLPAAERYNQEAAALGGKLDEPGPKLWPLLNGARIAERKSNPAEAERRYLEVLSRAAQEPDIALDAEAGYAALLDRQGRLAEADRRFQKTLAVVEQKRSKVIRAELRFSYFASLVQFYRQYVEFLSAQSRPLEALRIAESSRGRVLAEKLKMESAGVLDHPDALRKLAAASKTVLLSYWLAPQHSYVWVIAPAKITQIQLPPQPEIERLVDLYRRSIDDLRDPLETGNPAAQKLSEILLQPVEKLLPAGYRVAIVPDGRLNALNFEALPVGVSNPHYWLEDRVVSILPSLTVLAPNRPARRSPADSLLLIGNPLSPDARAYPPLPNAGAEIDAIRDEFPSGAEVHAGPGATPDVYASSQPERFDIIHFAAHATANPVDPLDSAVILSPGKDSFKLYARQIMNTPIGARLVTVSACSGAGARAYAGEGLVGFTWAFLRAGAMNVVSGLWEVDDASTAQIMKAMYRELRAGRSPAEALRAAKLELLHSHGPFRKPYYWAPFELFTRSLAP
jgi:CHAT domain-containing protein